MKEEKSKVNIRQVGISTGYLIEITNTPIDQVYAVTRDELEQIVLYGTAILKMKYEIRQKIYWWATCVYDRQIPLISWVADKIRDWTLDY